MVSIADYKGREQTYVKHVFLENYLEELVHKTASAFVHVVYIDGFAGPWQSANEKFEDTSFGIALNVLRQAKQSWKKLGRDVRMSAHLVERDATAYAHLSKVPQRYPDIEVKTYNGDFLTVISSILKDIPNNAFAFFLIDPKGWRIPLQSLKPMLARSNSEVIFNFMFDFINRAASMKDSAIVRAVDELVPFGDFRGRIEKLEQKGRVTSDERKTVLVEAFGESLARLGNFKYVAETTVLRPLKDRPLYCLFYASRHPVGIQAFRDCQMKALTEQSKTRATTKVKSAQDISGQSEMFESLHEMAPDELIAFVAAQREAAKSTLIELSPIAPDAIPYEGLWPQVLTRHVIRLTDLNEIAARLRKEGKLLFPDWEPRKRVPQPKYRVQRPR
ncbi:MAG: three-Cys-motif partner protein TcmP [Roseiarcus sp.]|jgi:three-Cys-motif partner protein